MTAMGHHSISRPQRAATVAGVVAGHLILLLLLLTMSGPPIPLAPENRPLETFDVSLPPPPPPNPPSIPTPARRKPEPEGAAAPPARKAEATPVNRVAPVVALPPVAPIVTAQTPGAGAAPAAGAAPVDGPGSGAGGTGSGTGSGSAGSGPGGGGGAASRPSLVSRPLTQRDFSPASRRGWPAGRRVLVTFDVGIDGRASDCKVFQSIGDPDIDRETCALVTRRLRFRPARGADGRPVVARYGYAQVAQF